MVRVEKGLLQRCERGAVTMDVSCTVEYQSTTIGSHQQACQFVFFEARFCLAFSDFFSVGKADTGSSPTVPNSTAANSRGFGMQQTENG